MHTRHSIPRDRRADARHLSDQSSSLMESLGLAPSPQRGEAGQVQYASLSFPNRHDQPLATSPPFGLSDSLPTSHSTNTQAIPPRSSSLSTQSCPSPPSPVHTTIQNQGHQHLPLPGHSNFQSQGQPNLNSQIHSNPTPQSNHNQPDLSIPVALLIDRLQDLQLQNRGHEAPRTRPITLPSPRYDTEGKISGLEFHRWAFLFCRTVESLKLSYQFCHLELATNKYILPRELRAIASESQDLKTTLERIRARFPPLSSLFPEIHRDIISIQPCTSNRER